MRLIKNNLLQDAIITPENNFNIVRLVLALLVVYFHAYPVIVGGEPLSGMLGPSMHLGSFAVGIFFFLSGLFVTQGWFKHPHAYSFFCRRVARIIPGLAVCIISTTLIAVCFFSDQGFKGLLQADTWSYIFKGAFIFFLRSSVYISSLRIPGVFSYLPETALNGPLWTLFWEGKFYIALGLIGMTAVTPSKYWFTFMGAVLLLYMGFDKDLNYLKYSLWEYKLLTLFLCGMIVYTLSSFITIEVTTLLGIIIYLFFNYQGMGEFGIYFLGCIVALWFGTLNIELLKYFRTHDYSYSIYIYHYPIIGMLKKFYPNNGWDFSLLAYTLLLLVPISYLSWRFIEKPAIDLGNRVSKALF